MTGGDGESQKPAESGEAVSPLKTRPGEQKVRKKNYAILAAEFHYTAPHLGALPDTDLPEVAFVGRSNVGKSSLLGKLTSTTKLVRVSKTPGQTRAIHYFKVAVRSPEGAEKELYFVDLPGYGYAKMSKTLRAEMSQLLSGYLGMREQLVAACHLLDIRHTPTGEDKDVLQQLFHMPYEHIIIGTKADKLVKSKRSNARGALAKRTNRTKSEITLFSSPDQIGREEVWTRIWNALPES